MELTINIPYVEHVGRAAKRVASVPVTAVRKTHSKVSEEVTRHAAQAIIDSERGRRLIVGIMMEGLENRERRKDDNSPEV